MIADQIKQLGAVKWLRRIVGLLSVSCAVSNSRMAIRRHDGDV